MQRVVSCVVGFLLCTGAMAVDSKAQSFEEPSLAMHLVATFEYPSCSELLPTTAQALNSRLRWEDLTGSKGFGYACFLVGGVDELSAVGFAVEGLSGIKGLKTDPIRWCPEGAMGFGDVLGNGGAVGFPCMRKLEDEEFILIGCVPFEYTGREDLKLSFAPSRFLKQPEPGLRISDCSEQYAEKTITRTSGGWIEGRSEPVTETGKTASVPKLLWVMDADGKTTINTFDLKRPGQSSAGIFEFPLIVINGDVVSLDEKGNKQQILEGEGVRWIRVSEEANRFLRCSRTKGRGTGSMKPWDLELVNTAGETVWSKPAAGHRGWISPDGASIAWQEVGHAGRISESFHRWVEGRGEVRVPGLAIKEGAFRRDGTLIGWGVALTGAMGRANAGDQGIFAVGRGGDLLWWVATEEVEVGALAVSDVGIILAGLEGGGTLAVDGWTSSGEDRFSQRIELDQDAQGRGTVAAAISEGGDRVAVAALPQGSAESPTLILLEGRTGREIWRKFPGQRFKETGLKPEKVMFSGDGSRVGVLLARMSDPPVFGVMVFASDDGSGVWRKQLNRCPWESRDFSLSETGEAVLFVGCGHASVYHVPD